MASPGTSADDIEERLRDLARTIAPGIRVSLESSAAEHGLYTLRLGACFRSSVSFPESELSNPEIVDERFRNAVDRLLAHARRELLFDAAPEYRQLSRLHEIATERTVQLSAIIEKALGEARASSIPLGMTESLFYWQMLRRVESTLAGYRSETGDDHEEHEFCDQRLGCVLSEEPPASWIQKRDAEKWEEGRAAWAKYELALSDAEASGQGYRVPSPVNPYRPETEADE